MEEFHYASEVAQSAKAKLCREAVAAVVFVSVVRHLAKCESVCFSGCNKLRRGMRFRHNLPLGVAQWKVEAGNAYSRSSVHEEHSVIVAQRMELRLDRHIEVKFAAKERSDFPVIEQNYFTTTELRTFGFEYTCPDAVRVW
jgi:hypothetical protein